MREKRGKSKLKIALIIAIIAIVVFLAWYFGKDYVFGNDYSDFEIDNVLLKTSLKKSGSVVSNVKITNINDKQEGFSIGVNHLEDFISLDEESFELSPGETKDLQIIFGNSKVNPPGIYLGNLEVSSDSDTKKVPIILEIESEDVLFDSSINLFSSNGDIIPGSKINAEIKLYDLVGSGKTSVDLTYYVKDFDGKTIINEEANTIIEGTPSLTKTIELPENIKAGDYVLGVMVSYENSIGTSTNYFRVKSKSESQGFLGLGDNFLVIIIILGFFFLVLLFLVYFMVSRDKLLLELNRQYKCEMRKQREYLQEKEKENYVKLKTVPEKKEYKKEIKKVKEKRLKAIKEIHEKRVKEFRKIKRTKKKDILKKQIESWKKQGYDTSVLENKYKVPNAGDIRKKINQWKKQGYDTRVLEQN